MSKITASFFSFKLSFRSFGIVNFTSSQDRVQALSKYIKLPSLSNNLISIF